MSRYSLDKAKIKVLLLEGVHPSAVDVFKAAGYSEAEILKSLQAKSRDNGRTPMQWSDEENAGFTTAVIKGLKASYVK